MALFFVFADKLGAFGGFKGFATHSFDREKDYYMGIVKKQSLLY